MVSDSGGKTTNDEPEPHQEHADENPTNLSARRSQQDSDGNTKPSKQQACGKKYDRIISGLTLFVLFLTFLAAVIAGYEGYRLANGTRDVIGRADTANQIARDSSKTALRSYVFVTDTPQPQIVLHGDYYTVEVKVKNSGQTPAYNLRTSLCSRVMPAITDAKNRNNILQPDQIRTDFSTDLGPGLAADYPDWPVGKHFPISAADLASIKDGHETIYVYGRIEYHDAFLGPKSCQIYEPRLRIGKATANGWELVPYSDASNPNLECAPGEVQVYGSSNSPYCDPKQ